MARGSRRRGGPAGRVVAARRRPGRPGPGRARDVVRSPCGRRPSPANGPLGGAACETEVRRHRSAATPRPNVMVVMMDDMRWDEVQYLPNVQRYVRDRGLRFTNSFSPYPLCCPARTSFLLGQYAHNHHVLYHDAPYGFGSIDDSRTIATSLERVGYRTAMVGKYLNGYGVMPSRVTGRSSIDYVPAGWTDWMAGWTRSGRTARRTGATPTTTSRSRRTSTASPSLTRAVLLDGDRRRGDRPGRRPWRERKATGKPWFLWVTPVAPHHGGPGSPTTRRRTPRSTASAALRDAGPAPLGQGPLRHRDHARRPAPARTGRARPT